MTKRRWRPVKPMSFIVAILFWCLVPLQGVANDYTGDGSWAVFEFGRGTTFVLAAEVYRPSTDKGAIPAFMVNYGNVKGCYFSVGLAIPSDQIPSGVTKKQMGEVLRQTLQRSEVLADREVIRFKDNDVQSLDMGKFFYARKLIDSDALVAFMVAKKGTYRIRGEDLVISFSMNGFKKTIDRIVKTRCS